MSKNKDIRLPSAELPALGKPSPPLLGETTYAATRFRNT